MNYDSSGTTEEKIKQNREWALKMALQRLTEAGCDPTPDESNDTHSLSKPVIYPKVAPPPTEPLPPISEKEFDITEPSISPKELGIFPPSLPHKLIDLVPRVHRSHGGIVAGVAVDSYEMQICDLENMIISCTACACYLYCPRGASLVRCMECEAVSPACTEPLSQETTGLRGDDGTERTGETSTALTDSGNNFWASEMAIRTSIG